MKLVIDISEDDYRKVQDGRASVSMMLKAIRSGTPLPKGHGRLIDADELKKIIKENDALTMVGFSVRLCDIDNAPTIIEADKGEGEK